MKTKAVRKTMKPGAFEYVWEIPAGLRVKVIPEQPASCFLDEYPQALFGRPGDIMHHDATHRGLMFSVDEIDGAKLIQVRCRTRGAIGEFYIRSFIIPDVPGSGRDQDRDKWFDLYGALWELHNIVS